jgi:hypothetical protein
MSPRVFPVLAFAILTLPLTAQFQALGHYYTQGHVAVAHAPDLDPGTITVEAWFYFDPTQPGGVFNGTIIRRHPWTSSYILRVASGAGGQLEWIIQVGLGSPTVVTSVNPVPFDSWHHVAATYDGNISRLFVDGVLEGQVAMAGTILPSPGTLRIKTGNNPNDQFRGFLDEVRIWSYARSTPQILETMFKRIDHHQGLVAAWHFDGDYVDHAQGHDGTPVDYVELVSLGAPIMSAQLRGPTSAYIGSPLVYSIATNPPLSPYLFDLSVTGQAPGIPLPSPAGAFLPLNPPLLNLQLGGSPFYSSFIGTTSIMGTASPQISLPPAAYLVGFTLSAAFVTLDPSGGVGVVSNGLQTTIHDLEPVVQQVSPSTSRALGGTALTITGLHFMSGASVSVNGVAAANVVVMSSTTITCLCPAGVVGPAVVEVTNSDGGSASFMGFAFVANLVLASSMVTGSTPGATCAILGGGFQPGLALTVDGVPVVPLSVTPGAITFQMTSSLACNTPAFVTNPDLQTGAIMVNAQPQVALVYPAIGPASGGNLAFVLGAQLDPGSAVRFNGASASVLAGTSDALLVVVPSGLPGGAIVQVTSPAGCSANGAYLYQ